MPQPPARTVKSSSRSLKRSKAGQTTSAAATRPDSDRLVGLGQIGGPHAIHGEVRLRLYNPTSSALAVQQAVVLRRGAAREVRRIIGLRRNKRVLLLHLDGCETMTAAEALVGYEVCVDESELPPLRDGEIYVCDLVGLEVVTTGGDLVGAVVEVMAAPSADVCVVQGGGREHLIPLIADIVRRIDRDAGRLIIEPVPGLLDG